MKTHLSTRAVVAATLLLCGSVAQAQSYGRRGLGFEPGESMFLFNWEVSPPIGDFHDYISNWGLRGFSAEGRYMLPQRISLGASFSVNRWSQTFDNLQVDLPNGNISGPVFRYADMFAIRFLAHYYFMDGPIQPYIGVGIGGVWAYAFSQIVDLGSARDSFNFIVDPEIGLLYQVYRGSTSVHLNLALRYTFTTAQVANGKSNMQWLTTPVVGLAWSY